MSENLKLREGGPEDGSALEKLYPQAFPEEDLLPLVRRLVTAPETLLSLVAEHESALAASLFFSACSISGGGKAALLGPVAVAPALQRRGVGSALVTEGLSRLRVLGMPRVFVLGDPAWYGRFGFSADSLVSPPCALPAEWAGAWQSLALGDDGPPATGTLHVPDPWADPVLWLP